MLQNPPFLRRFCSSQVLFTRKSFPPKNPLYLLNIFNRTREIPLRSIIWGTANAGMSIITGFINYGIGENAVSHPSGLAPWKGISLFLGTLTIFLSILAYFILGTPREVRWLSESEKRMAAARIVANQTGSDRVERHVWKWDQVLTTFKDPQTYFFFFVTIVNSLPNGGTTSFGNLVYVSFGFTALETLIKGTIPQQLVSIVWFLIVGIVTLKKPGLRCKIKILLLKRDVLIFEILMKSIS